MIIRAWCINNFSGAVFTLGLLGFIYGNTLGWSSPVELKLKSNSSDDNPFKKPVQKEEIGWIISLLSLGASAGCWAFALLMDVLGRRPSVILLSIPMAGCYLAMVYLKELYVFYVARFVLGISVGGIMVVTSVYQTEIPPKHLRGTIFAWAGMMISSGALLSYCVGPFITITTFNIVLMVFPLTTALLAFVFCEETPYYWIMKNNSEKAKVCLKAYRKIDANIDDEIKEIEEKIREQYEGNLFDILNTKAFLRSFIMGNTLMVFQQFTGIFALLMYNESFFHMAGSNLKPYISAIIIGSLFLCSASLGSLVLERFNRKTLLIASAMGMIISQVSLGTYCSLDEHGYDIKSFKFLPVISLGSFIFCYNLGCGPLTWVVASEIYPIRAKAFCLSFSVFLFFITGTLITKYFSIIVEFIGLGVVCFIFASCCLFSIFFTIFFLIETRGKTLGEIQDKLKNK